MLRRILLPTLLLTACGGSAPPPSAPTPAPTVSEKPAPEPKPAEAAEASDGCPEGMRRIPGGELFMGSPDGQGVADEHPEHKVAVADFCLDAREVSAADYDACVKNGICKALPKEARTTEKLKPDALAQLGAACSARSSDGSVPANCVELEAAKKFCAWKGHRLPTESEWEWAASGGSDGLSYPWGATPPSDTVACWQHTRGACHVGSKPAEAFELQDMGGNVSEWTDTRYGPYPDAPAKGEVFVVRGANFATTSTDDMRVARRRSAAASDRLPTIGFRCASGL